MSVLVGEVQQWIDGRWRTVLTEYGTPVTDRRRRAYDKPEEGVLFGFDGARGGPTVMFHNGRFYNFPRGPR